MKNVKWYLNELLAVKIMIIFLGVGEQKRTKGQNPDFNLKKGPRKDQNKSNKADKRGSSEIVKL